MTTDVMTISSPPTYPSVINFDLLLGEVLYVRPVQTLNATVNFRGSSSSTLNSLLSDRLITARLILRTGTRSFIPQTFYVDGVIHYPDFLNGSQTKSVSTNRMIEYTFKFYKDGNNIYSMAFVSQYAPTIKGAVAVSAR